MNTHIMQQWRCTHDRNGNPRRLWMFFDIQTGEITEVMEDGYAGKPQSDAGSWVEISPVDITYQEYASTKRFAKERGCYIAR